MRGTWHRRLRPRSPLGAFVLFCALTVILVATPTLIGGVAIHVLTHPLRSNASAALNPPNAPLYTPPAWYSVTSNQQSIAVNPHFATYYASTAGAARLGAAITPAMPIDNGWLQFFTAGALFLSGRAPVMSTHWVAQASDNDADDVALTNATSTLNEVIAQITRDATGDVTPLPLLSLLVHAGSEVEIGGLSNFSYANLRQAIDASQLRPAPAWYAPNRPAGATGAFVPEATEHGAVLGHLVPLSFWTMMTQSGNAPDGWIADFGLPETEALPVTATVNGATHHLLVQVFQQIALVVDTTTDTQTAQPLSIGADYLRTFGPPPVRVAPATPAWVTVRTATYVLPRLSSPVLVHLGLGYPLTLTAATRWASATLWYQVTWSGPHGHATGWIPASAVTFGAAPAMPARAGIDVLDPGLASYLAGFGDLVGVAISDLSHNVYYTNNADDLFITGSSVKVPIMLALLNQTEAQGREPDDNEMYLLSTMIENSNNASAQALYEAIGDAPGLTATMAQFGVSGLYPSPGSWGWSHITPAAMIQLLTLLQSGRILTAQDRGLALYLMEHVESDQQFGVGDTAPAGSVVAMKNGWVTGPDNLWVVNTSGVVTTSTDTYIISVYTRSDASYPQGVAIVEHVCATVSADLG